MYRRFFLPAALGLAISTPVAAGDLDIRIGGVNSGDGRIMVALFDAAEAFMGDDTQTAALMLPAQPGGVRALIGNLPPGRYAISVYHDANGNQALDTNLLGLPREGYGFSNDARGMAGPPSFEAASFEIGADPATVELTLSY